MKPLALVLIIFLATTAASLAQSGEEKQVPQPTDNAKTPAMKQQSGPPAETTTDEQMNKLKGFIDVDGDGIDDRKLKSATQSPLHRGNGMHERRRDHFIDSDGDGINDNRCNGMGFGAKNRKRGGGGQK